MNDGIDPLFLAAITSTSSSSSGLTLYGGGVYDAHDLNRRARSYRVLNRNVWWNRPALVRVEAVNEFAAIEALLASSAPAPRPPRDRG